MRHLLKKHAAKLLVCLIVLFLGACSLIKPAPKPSPQPEPAPEQTLKKEPPAKPPDEPPATPPPKPPPAPPPALEKPKPALPPALRVTRVEWSSVNLREGPGMNYKVVGNARKGTSLGVLEDRGQWLRVRLDDGKEAWVYKASTVTAPKPASPSSSPKPRPM